MENMSFYSLLLFILVFVFWILSILKSKANYWKNRGVPSDNRKNVLGIFWDFLTKDQAFFQLVSKLYDKYPDFPAVGTVSFLTPALVVRSPENIRQILAGDTASFNHRGIDVNGDVDPLADNLLLMNGIRWKLTRQKMTPLFTAAKLKNMFYIMDRNGRDFVDYIRTKPTNQKAFDTLNIFCAAAVCSSIFGLGTKSSMDSPLLDMARKVVAPSMAKTVKITLVNTFPTLFRLLKLKVFVDYEDFFIDAMKKVLRARELDSTRKHDFADLCLELQKSGTMKDPTTGYEIEPTDELMAAQAFFFIIAGVEPSATAMFFVLFEMAKHPEMLKKLHEEVDQTYEECKGDITYEAIAKMEYLDKVLDESMRMYPPIGSLNRKCTKNDVLPHGNILVEKDTLLFIPVYSIHHDPEYYPNPETFDPERFSLEAKQSRPKYTYLPFGDGHRVCLAARFARLQMKTGLVHVLRHFTVRTSDADKPIRYFKLPVQVTPANINFEFVERKTLN